jgi:hypothetical protein
MQAFNVLDRILQWGYKRGDCILWSLGANLQIDQKWNVQRALWK